MSNPAKDNIHWQLRKQLLFLYEIDTDALARVIPAGLEPMEIRPGIALCAIECMHYRTGHFRPGYREFFELVFGAAVQPNLSIEMPLPKFCIHGISILSDSEEFVEQECRLLFTPTGHAPNLRLEFTEDGTGCDVFDGADPILSCRNTHEAPPVYERKTLWGQYYTDTKGLQQGIWRWQGELFEHMKNAGGDYGRFHAHPFFKGVDMSRVRGCYRQMIGKPETVMTLSRWVPGDKPTS
jgi:hypothetical protein